MTAAIPSPTDATIGPVHAYALCILLGIVVAVWMGQRRLDERGGPEGGILDIAAWAVPFGIIGGRIYHVITTPQPYFGEGGDPVDALKIWEGGLGIWGAVAVGAVGAWIACRRYEISFLTFADAAAPGILVAQAIGRFVRSRRPGETASIFLPSVPNLLQLASEMEAQRNHVLGKPHRESDGLDDELIADANKTKDEKSDQDRGFESLGADAELDLSPLQAAVLDLWERGLMAVDSGDLSMVDRVELVDDEEAKQMALRLMREEGILCGISCGAAMAAAV